MFEVRMPVQTYLLIKKKHEHIKKNILKPDGLIDK